MAKQISRLQIWCAALLLCADGAWAGVRACTGDCGEDGFVTVDEIVTTVTLALDGGSIGACASADADGSGDVTVDEVVAAVNNALFGCPAPDPTPTASPPPPTTATATPVVDATPAGEVPTGGAELLPWLQAGSYLGWRSESLIHASGGPHPVTVRTFVNDTLFDSLNAGGVEHPRGAAAVKELYGSAGTLRGWAVSVKVSESSAGGNGWYWYERSGSSVFADSTGAGICTGCHGGDYRGFVDKDFILIPFPLQ